VKTVRDEHAANLSIPEIDYQRHVDRPNLFAKIERRLKACRCLVLWGLAGAGKSELAATYASQHEGDYELTIWLEADHIRRVEDLRAVPLLRGGESRNVATLLATRRCLLILDDVRDRLSPEGLADLCRDGAHVILGDVAARQDLESAITACLDPKFKLSLQQRLAEAAASPLPS
jgi:hypothetical protein